MQGSSPAFCLAGKEPRALVGFLFVTLVETGGIEPQRRGLEPNVPPGQSPKQNDCTIVHLFFDKQQDKMYKLANDNSLVPFLRNRNLAQRGFSIHQNTSCRPT